MSTDTIRDAEVDRICASAAFQRAPVMRRLLRFLVAETVAGRGDGLKAYVIAVDGLGKNSDFDPQTDSYPRVQVGRLRRMIGEFYDQQGKGDGGLHLAIPNGGYKVFWSTGMETTNVEVAAASPAPLPPTRTTRRPTRPWAIALTLGMILLLSGAWVLWNGRHAVEGNPSLAAVAERSLASAPIMNIVPVNAVDGADPAMAQRIDRVLSDALHRSWALSVRPAGTTDTKNADEPSDYRLTGTLVGKDRKLLYLTVWNARDGTQFWSQRLEMANVGSLREALSPTITAIMSPFGVIGSRERRILSRDFTPGFPCMMRYTEFYKSDSANLAAPVERCLTQTLQRDPGYSPAIAAKIILRLREGTKDPAKADTARTEALSLARRAVDADPYSADAAMAMAVAAYANGLCDLGRANALQALERNPFDSYAQARTGLFMYQCGDSDFEAPLKRAWALDTTLPPLTALPLFVSMGDRGEGEAALHFALSLPAAEGYRKPAYDLTMAVAYAAAGDRTQARDKWQSAMRAVQAAPDAKPRMVLQRIVLTPQLATRTEAYLRDRGVFS